MRNQEFVVEEVTLSDLSKVYNVVAFDGKSRLTINADCKRNADEIANLLNKDAGIVGFQIDTFKA